MVRLYRSLLWFYPAEFRDEYGRELCLMLTDQLRSERSPAVRLWTWLAAVLALVIEGFSERCRLLTDDLRATVRGLRKSPGLAAAAIAVFALGIGSTTTVFTLVNGLLLRPLPYPDHGRLAYVSESKNGRLFGSIAFPNYLDFRARNRSFTDLGVYSEGGAILRSESGPERVPAAGISTGVLKVLGIAPIAGRAFTEEEDRPNGPRVALLGYGLWQRRFGGATSALGKTVYVNDQPTTVVGIMPQDFRFPELAELWQPLQLSPQQSTRTDHFLHAVARLRPGVSFEQAAEDMRGLMVQINRENPVTSYGQSATAVPWRDRAAENYRRHVVILMAAVSFVLLIACANIMSLLLCRVSGRIREMALRTALGAARVRVMRLFVMESVILSLSGAAVGSLLAVAGVRGLLALIPIELPMWLKFDIDVRVLAFTLLICAAAGVIGGLIPAIAGSRVNIGNALKEGSRGATDRGSRRWLRGLVVAELAVTLPLLAGAVLMVRSFLALRSQPLGFETERVLTLEYSLPTTSYERGESSVLAGRRLREEIAALPGVVSVAATTGAPLSSNWGRSFTADGYPVLSVKDAPSIQHVVTTPGYFRTLGIPLIEGRDFTEKDGKAPLVTIIDQGLAKRYWPNTSALGKRVRYGPPENNEPWHTVVGVAATVRNQQVNEIGKNTVYLPHGEFGFSGLTLMVRTAGAPKDIASAVRARIAAVDAGIAVSRLRTLEEIVTRAVWRERLLAYLMAGFAVFAVLLSGAGLYAVIAYLVSQRTHEIGIRIALGASPSRLQASVIGEGLWLTAAGIVPGAGIALALSRAVATQLYNIQPADPASFAAVAAALLALSVAAAWIPARHATRIDPLAALRSE